LRLLTESFGRALLEPEFDFDPTGSLHSVDPLPCDRWLASSALQKAIRRGEVLTAERALRTLYRHDPRSTWRRLLVIACEDVGIASLPALLIATRRSASARTSLETERDETAALATARTLAESPKDRSADLLLATALHDPALDTMRARCRSVPVARRLEWVAEPVLSLPERAVAAWLSSGVESRGEPRVGPGDIGALMRTYAGLGVPEALLEAVATAIRKTREPLALFLPLLWLAAAGSETKLARSSPPPSGLIDGVPLYALDKHTRLGRIAIDRFGAENASIAQFLAEHGHSRNAALRMAVFYAEGAFIRPALRWRGSAEIAAKGVAADFHKVHVVAGIGAALIRLVRAHIADLDAIRSQVLRRALRPPEASVRPARFKVDAKGGRRE
jgi:hypothetical protein